MTLTSTRKKTKEEKLREEIQHLSVDMEYSSREGNSAYSERVNKKLDKLYNMLDRIASRGKKV
jgi:pyrroloquinoline quinone (PQQ) biosynthesis protein C